MKIERRKVSNNVLYSNDTCTVRKLVNKPTQGHFWKTDQLGSKTLLKD